MRFVILILLFCTACTSYDAYFCPEDDCENILVDFVNESDVVCAFYDLDLDKVINVLKENNATVIIYHDNFFGDFISVKRKGLMHNKFCVNKDKVLTGSFNPTKRGAYFNNNNILIIKSRKIANEYRNYFYFLNNSNYIYEKSNVYFCPMDGCVNIVSNELMKAKKSIYFMTFSFTSKDIANVLLIKHYENITIEGVFEKQQNSIYSVYELLKYHDLDVKIDGNPYKLHHKVFIIDNQTIITGSFNPSNNANKRNDENIIIVKNEEIAKKYVKEFLKIKSLIN